MSDTTHDAAKLLPEGLAEADRPIFEIVTRYLRDVTHDVSYLEDRAVEIIQLVRANTRPQLASPAGEPDYARIAREFLGRWAGGAGSHPLAVEYFECMYRLGLAARPKVEDAEVTKIANDLRESGKVLDNGVTKILDAGFFVKAADLLERLAGEAADNLKAAQGMSADVTNLGQRLEAAESKLAEREAELAEEDWARSKETAWDWSADEEARIERIYEARRARRHAARQQQQKDRK